MAIIALVIGLMMVSSILPDVVDEAASTAYSDTTSVATLAVTTATVTLTYDHYFGDTRKLTVTSDRPGDSPAITGYDAATKVVSIDGLEASQTRLLTINYYKEAHQQYTGFSAFLRIIPFLAIIGIVMAALWALFSHWKRE